MPPVIVAGPSNVHCARLINALVATSTDYIVQPRRARTYEEAYLDITDWFSLDGTFFVYDSFPHIQEWINDAPLTTARHFTLRQEALDYRLKQAGGRLFIVSSPRNSLNAAYRRLAEITALPVYWFDDQDLFDPEVVAKQLLDTKKK